MFFVSDETITISSHEVLEDEQPPQTLTLRNKQQTAIAIEPTHSRVETNSMLSTPRFLLLALLWQLPRAASSDGLIRGGSHNIREPVDADAAHSYSWDNRTRSLTTDDFRRRTNHLSTSRHMQPRIIGGDRVSDDFLFANELCWQSFSLTQHASFNRPGLDDIPTHSP